MNQSFAIKAGLLHFEWFLADAGVLRLFRRPFGKIDEKSGQPVTPFDWVCTLWRDNGVLWIKGVKELPETAVVLSMIRIGLRLPGVRRVLWDTLGEKGWHMAGTAEFRDQTKNINRKTPCPKKPTPHHSN